MFTIGKIQKAALTAMKRVVASRPQVSKQRDVHVSVIGATKPLGQSTLLLLRQNPHIHRLTMYDDSKSTYGVALDVAHIPREASVQGWIGKMEYALKGSNIVVVACGEPRQDNETETQHFYKNADKIVESMKAIAEYSPSAFIVIATDPINQMVPLASQVLQSCNSYNKRKLLGVSGLYTMRAQTCVGRMFMLPPQLLKLPVICGNSPNTAVPLFSHIQPWIHIDNTTAVSLTEAIKSVDETVAGLKVGNGESTLSLAYAVHMLVDSVVRCMYHNYPTEHMAFIDNNIYGTRYFASPIIIQSQGICAVREYPTMSALEGDYLYLSSQQLVKDIKIGENYLMENTPKKKKISKDILSKCTY